MEGIEPTKTKTKDNGSPFCRLSFSVTFFGEVISQVVKSLRVFRVVLNTFPVAFSSLLSLWSSRGGEGLCSLLSSLGYLFFHRAYQR
jgi:hypothetical protein